MARAGAASNSWQREADLLADGRVYLERLCNRMRYRHLFPGGPDLSLLLGAYQDLERQRTVGRVAPDAVRQARRILRRELRRRLQAEIAERSLRLTYRLPVARPREVVARLPELAERALASVDADARDEVRAHVLGRPREVLAAELSAGQSRVQPRIDRGLAQLRDALVFQALANPSEIAGLHPQLLRFAAAPLPTVRQHPVARFIFVKLPIYLWLGFIGFFSVVYIAAYFFLNDEALGRLLTRVIDAQINGRIELGSVHWRPDLIFDLITGRPHHATVTGLKIWGGYKLAGKDEPDLLLGAGDGPIEADIVLHEIIPWNRFLVPPVLEVPWVLHFTEVRTEAPLALNATERLLPQLNAPDAWVVDLIDAMGPYAEFPPLSTRGISIRIDHTDIAALDLDLDFRPQTGWQTELGLRDVHAALLFEGLHPKKPPPKKKPLQFAVEALADDGMIRIPLIGYEFPVDDLEIGTFAAGGDYPLGDIRIAAEGAIGGSRGVYEGWLRDIFSSEARSVEMTALFGDAGEIGRIITRAHGLADSMIDAHGAPAQVTFRGPFSDVEIGLTASGAALNFFTDPTVDWAIRDAAIDLTLAQDPVPEQWEPWIPIGEQRWVIDLARFEGQVLGGRFRLREHEARNHLVLGTGPERRLLMAAQTLLTDVDPGEIVGAGGTRALLAGTASGELDVRALAFDLGPPEPNMSEETGTSDQVHSTTPADVTYADAPALPPEPRRRKKGPKARGAAAEPVAQRLGEAVEPPGAHDVSLLERLDLGLTGLKIERRRGPADDSLPRRFRLDGGVLVDRANGLDLSDLVVTVDGATLRIDGGLDTAYANLKPTDLRLKITDGKAFFDALGQAPYVERLTAGLTVHGPLGRPSGSNGSLQVSDVGTGQFALRDVRDVSLGLHSGVLSLRSPRTSLLGGQGALDVDVGLFDGTGLASDPTLRATLDFNGVDLARIAGGSVGGTGDVRIDIGDDAGKPLPLSKFQARGALFVPALKIGHGELRDTQTDFQLSRDGLVIDKFVARQHRKISPSAAPDLTLPIGELQASGAISFDADPRLDLVVTAKRLPVSTFTDIAGITDLPAGAQIDSGTQLGVTGTLARPSVHGTVELTAINAVGIPLGSGELELDSNDRPAGDGLAARREILVKGRFGDDGGRKRRTPYDWDVDAVVAIGEARRGMGPRYGSDLEVHFANLPLHNLLRAAGVDPGAGLHGQAEGLTVTIRTCPEGQPLLTSCLWRDDSRAEDLKILIELDRLWAAARAPNSGVQAGSNQPGDPCRDRESLCSSSRLVATLQGTRLSLRDGWDLRSGGTGGQTLTMSGDVELSTPPAAAASAAPRTCDEPPPAARTPPPTGASARLQGQLMLAGLRPFLSGSAVSGLDGKIALDMTLDGHVGDPIITGSFTVPDATSPILAKADGIAFSVPKLSLQWSQDALLAGGELNVRGQTLQFGDLGGRRSFYVLGGPCQGSFSVAARGQLDGRMLREFLPDTFAASGGGLEVREAHVAGRVGEALDLRTARARLEPSAGGLRFQAAGVGLDVVDLTEGAIEVQRCGDDDPCPSRQDGFGVFIGGSSSSADDATAPEGALRARVGDRGRMTLWGSLVLAPDLQRIATSSLRVDLDEIQYRMFDNSGRPQLYATVSSEGLVLEGKDVQTLRGEVLVERGRWVRDAQEGVKVLSFADPTNAPASPPPEILRDMNLDLRIRTTAPFRVENNVMKGVEGQVLLALGGTIGDLEMSGKIDVTAGVLDVAILNGAYDIQYGRVYLEETLTASTVDVMAQRQEPIYIDNQPRRMFVRLGGTLDAITWRCIVQGDTRARSRTTRECVDYLVLGAGNREVADSNVRRYGSGGLLGRPLGLVGNLTQLKLNRYVEQSAPRLAPYIPEIGMQLGQLGIEVNAETPRPWFRSDWGSLTIGAGYTRGYPGLLLRNSYDWRIRFRLLDTASLEFRDNRRSYFNERIIFDPLRQRSLELRLDYQLPSFR